MCSIFLLPEGKQAKQARKKQASTLQLMNVSVSGTRLLREENLFRESFAAPSSRPVVCSVCPGCIVAAAVTLAETVGAEFTCAGRLAVGVK